MPAHDCSHHHDHDHDHTHCDHGDARASGLSDYCKHGLRFQFPSDWTLTEQSDEDETTITIQSSGTSFWTLVIFNSQPDPEAVLETIVSAFEDDYEEVDVASGIESIAGIPSLVRDLDFVCYDLVNSASARAFETSEHTVMVLYQGTDHELEVTRSQMQAISASLQIEDDDTDWSDEDDANE